MSSAPAGEPLGSPLISLPRFTFLCGPFNSGRHALADALCELNPAFEQFSFLDPLLEASRSILLSDKENDYPWIEDFRQFIVTRLGPSHLGNLALTRYLDFKSPGIDSTLFIDCINPFDAQPFIDRFGPTDCLCLHLGSLYAVKPQGEGLHHIWLPQSGHRSQLAALLHELEPSPPAGATRSERVAT